MASYKKQLSLLKPGLSVAVSVNTKREVKVHSDVDSMMSSITITPPGSPPGALAPDQTDIHTTDQQIQAQKLREANLLTPNASPTHETDAYSLMKSSHVYHPSPVVKSPPRVNKSYSLPPPTQPRADFKPTTLLPSKPMINRKVSPHGFPHHNIVDEAIVELFRKIDTPHSGLRSGPVHIQRHAIVDRIPIVMPADLQAYEKEKGREMMAEPCPECNQLPGPVFDMDCDNTCHRPSTPPNLTVNDYRSAMEDVCKYDMPTLVRARELADLALWSKRAEYSRKSFLQSIFDVNSLNGDEEKSEESDVDSSDEEYILQSPALEARLRRRMKKAKRRRKEMGTIKNLTVQPTESDEQIADPAAALKPRIMVTTTCRGSSDVRVPDLKIHTYIPTDHNSYCAPAKSPKSTPHVEQHGMDGIVVVKEPNGRLNTTVPGSLPTDSSTPRKILSQVGQRKRTCMPASSPPHGLKKAKRSLAGREEVEGDSSSRAMLIEKKEKHKQSERIRRNKSSLLIKSLQSYIAMTCGKAYFKCKNRSENPSKQATVETTVARFWELERDNNNALASLNSTFSSTMEVLKALQRQTQSSGRCHHLVQSLKSEAEELKSQISHHSQQAQTYGK